MEFVIDISRRRVVRWSIYAVLAAGLIIGWHCYRGIFGNTSEVRLNVISPDGTARCEIVDVEEGMKCLAVITVYARQGKSEWRQIAQKTIDNDSAIVGDLAVDWQLDYEHATQAVRVFEPGSGGNGPDLVMEVRLPPQ